MEGSTTLCLQKADMVYVDKVEQGWAMAYKQDERRRRRENQWVPQAHLARPSYYVARDSPGDETAGYATMVRGDRAINFVQQGDHWVSGSPRWERA